MRSVIDENRTIIQHPTADRDAAAVHFSDRQDLCGNRDRRCGAGGITHLLCGPLLSRTTHLPVPEREPSDNDSECRRGAHPLTPLSSRCRAHPALSPDRIVGPAGIRPAVLLSECILKWVLVIAFLLIIGSLASAMVFLIRDRGQTRNVVRALALRIGLSVLLFLTLLFSNWMGWIQSTGVPIQ